MNAELIDIVIPLSAESRHDNIELRMALRSIARCGRGIGQVYIVTDALPGWCRNVRLLRRGDPHRHNKDANLIEKLLAACRLERLRRHFLFWSDDQVALRLFDAAGLVPIYNNRAPEHFAEARYWQKRMLHTFDYLEHRGFKLRWNWDSHVPQPMDKIRFRQLLEPIDFATLPGYCVNTLYFGLAAIRPLVAQSQVKATFESSEPVVELPKNKLFLGYNDAAFESGLMTLLERRFPEKCSYEA